MADLSPTAQAVFEAYMDAGPTEADGLAAAFRVAADQVAAADALYASSCCEFIGGRTRHQLLAIAEELESSNI